METYDHLILGGGMTAQAAVEGIREIDPDATIGLITEESYPPYKRPPLSKKLWKDLPLKEIWYDIEKLDVHLHKVCRILALDPVQRFVTDATGKTYQYKKLLLATGGTPRKLPVEGVPIIYFRTLEDYLNLRNQSGHKKKMAVIGGGFIGSEIAAALATNHDEVMMIFPETGINERILPGHLSIFLNRYYEDRKVQVISRHILTRVERRGDSYLLNLKSVATGMESIREADVIVAGLGIVPSDALAKKAGLKVSDGVEVDEYLCTSHPDIYAAGDVANFYSQALKRRVRIEHEDNALQMGRCAGRNMAGAGHPYTHLSYFYSDLFDLGYEAVGELDPRLDTVEDWVEPHHKGVIYYRKDEIVRGVLLWNVWDQVPKARALIESNKPMAPSALKGLIS